LQPAQRALAGAGYWRLEQATDVRESELRQLYGIGPAALDQLQRALAARRLSLAGAPSTKDELL
jgi:hypothetical protein